MTVIPFKVDINTHNVTLATAAVPLLLHVTTVTTCISVFLNGCDGTATTTGCCATSAKYYVSSCLELVAL